VSCRREGHVLLYDEETGDFCGLTLIGVRRAVENGGSTTVTLPMDNLRELVCA